MAGRSVGDANGGIAQGAADLPLQAAHAGLAGIGLDDPGQRRLVDLDLFGFEAVGLQLLADQIALGDLQFFAGRVA